MTSRPNTDNTLYHESCEIARFFDTFSGEKLGKPGKTGENARQDHPMAFSDRIQASSSSTEALFSFRACSLSWMSPR